jgi:hypothetical protein
MDIDLVINIYRLESFPVKGKIRGPSRAGGFPIIAYQGDLFAYTEID